MFVLILLTNIDDKTDTSTASFTLSKGEVIEKLKGNIDHPNKKYTYRVESIFEHDNIFIKAFIVIKDDGKIMYQSENQLSGFKNP